MFQDAVPTSSLPLGLTSEPQSGDMQPRHLIQIQFLLKKSSVSAETWSLAAAVSDACYCSLTHSSPSACTLLFAAAAVFARVPTHLFPRAWLQFQYDLRFKSHDCKRLVNAASQLQFVSRASV